MDCKKQKAPDRTRSGAEGRLTALLNENWEERFHINVTYPSDGEEKC